LRLCLRWPPFYLPPTPTQNCVVFVNMFRTILPSLVSGRASTRRLPLSRSRLQNPLLVSRFFAVNLNDPIQKMIDTEVKSNPIVLFMKGTPEAPRCGFSRTVVNLLKEHNVEFKSFDVLENEDLRAGIKVYGNWPFIPQLYVNGEFVGGHDVIVALYKEGQLKNILDKAKKSKEK